MLTTGNPTTSSSLRKPRSLFSTIGDAERCGRRGPLANDHQHEERHNVGQSEQQLRWHFDPLGLQEVLERIEESDQDSCEENEERLPAPERYHCNRNEASAVGHILCE